MAPRQQLMDEERREREDAADREWPGAEEPASAVTPVQGSGQTLPGAHTVG